METIDQLACGLSLGATAVLALLALSWSLWRTLGRHEPVDKCVEAFFRSTIAASLLSGSVLLAVFIWLVGALDLRTYHHHFALFVWFIAFITNAALGAALAFLGALLLARTSS
jgi:hypothetical protein